MCGDEEGEELQQTSQNNRRLVGLQVSLQAGAVTSGETLRSGASLQWGRGAMHRTLCTTMHLICSLHSLHFNVSVCISVTDVANRCKSKKLFQ